MNFHLTPSVSTAGQRAPVEDMVDMARIKPSFCRFLTCADYYRDIHVLVHAMSESIVVHGLEPGRD